MNAQDKFAASVREACEKHGKNKWGQKHSEHVIASMFADEIGAEVKDVIESDAMKYAAKVVNPSAFAQWMESHVEGFKREGKKERATSIVKGFSLDAKVEEKK